MNALVLIGGATMLATYVGGSIALQLRNSLHLVLGYSAGALLGVVLFGLVPEVVASGNGLVVREAVCCVALGFGLYLIVQRMATAWSHSFRMVQHHLGPASLTFHSFIDGVGIGIAFHASMALGMVVAAGVIMHDFADGINTVSVSLDARGERHIARRWLLADALAPVFGISATFLFKIPETWFKPLLALFAGFFLYVGASVLVPQSYQKHPKFWTSLSTLLGMGTLYLATTFANI